MKKYTREDLLKICEQAFVSEDKWHKLIEYGNKTKFYQCMVEPFELFIIRTDDLNDTVEIIEEDKKIEKIGFINYCETPTEAILHKKIDEIIDKINNMEE